MPCFSANAIRAVREFKSHSRQGGHDLDVRIDGVIAQFEAHLVVALARCAVADRIGPFQGGDLHLPFGDQRPGNGGAQQVLTFVDYVGPEGREDVILDEGFFQIVHVGLGCAGLHGVGLDMFQRIDLTDVGAEGHHLTFIRFDEPPQDDRGIQAP